MRQYIITAFLITFFMASCKKAELSGLNNPTVLDGIYAGTFQRLPNPKISIVTIIFSSDEWMGDSRVFNYPSLCHGYYKIERDSINFSNYCTWIMGMDWSLILSHKYKIKVFGRELEIKRVYPDSLRTDLYKLVRQ